MFKKAIVHNMPQNSKEWHDVRKLKFTASNASTILAQGKGLDTLIDEMLADYYSSGNYEEYTGKYKNAQMQRGNDFEDKARKIYELETGQSVEQVGFVEIDENIGCSPDGIVSNSAGLVEFKSHNDKVFLKLAEDRKIDKKYKDQMQMQMFITGRDWCDYFGFNPNFDPCYIKIRVEKDLSVFGALSESLAEAKRRLTERKKYFDKIFRK